MLSGFDVLLMVLAFLIGTTLFISLGVLGYEKPD